MKSPFRAIRQKLFTEGKLVRYLGYAVGEVLLIIVGILLSLKIYDWNEDRKAQAEFELYVAQLREDVSTAIANGETSNSMTHRFIKAVEYIPAFLELSNYEPEELKAFEAGLSNLPLVGTPQIKVGILGQLLDGKLDIISRDPTLARKALEMESYLEMNLQAIERNSEQMVLVGALGLTHFLGIGETALNPTVPVPPKYDLKRLKADEKFLYVINHAQGLRTRILIFNNNIIGHLEDFLAVLEEYE